MPDTECVQALSESHQNCADTGVGRNKVTVPRGGYVEVEGSEVFPRAGGVFTGGTLLLGVPTNPMHAMVRA